MTPFEEKTLTEEQKERVLQEIEHYLAMDCYDFGVSVGWFNLMAGELLGNINEAIEEELDYEDDDCI